LNEVESKRSLRKIRPRYVNNNSQIRVKNQISAGSLKTNRGKEAGDVNLKMEYAVDVEVTINCRNPAIARRYSQIAKASVDSHSLFIHKVEAITHITRIPRARDGIFG
jgi:hypothetical protein